MNKQIEALRKIRISLLAITKDLTTEQLNEIPTGFNNNIIWNLAHLTSALQGVCYLRAGLKEVVEEKYSLPFKPNTKPEKLINESDIETIKALLLSSLDQLEEDYQNNAFVNYTTWTTRYGAELRTIDDALDFLPYHEGLHTGYIMALKRIVNK